MNPVPAGLPSQSIFLKPPVSSFFFAGAAPEDAAVAVSPNPETRVARRPANALRVKRLESTVFLLFGSVVRAQLHGNAKLKMSVPAAVATYCVPTTAYFIAAA